MDHKVGPGPHALIHVFKMVSDTAAYSNTATRKLAKKFVWFLFNGNTHFIHSFGAHTLNCIKNKLNSLQISEKKYKNIQNLTIYSLYQRYVEVLVKYALDHMH